MLGRLLAYARGMVRRTAIGREADEELLFHIEMETQTNIARGLSPAEARRMALRDLGGLTQARESVRDVRTTVLDTLRHDLRYAVRALRRDPAWTAVFIAVLSLGIAANTAVFSLVDAVVLRPLPVSDPASLRFVWGVFSPSGSSESGVPFRTYEALAQQNGIYSGVAGFHPDAVKIGWGLSTRQARGERVTTDYFTVVGVRAARGRTFVAADDSPAAEAVVVVSDRFWRTHLNANPDVIGTSLEFRATMSMDATYLTHRQSYTIIGVMPPDFRGLGSVWAPAEYWVPIRRRTLDLVQAEAEAAGGLTSRDIDRHLDQIGVMLIARLQSGVANAAMETSLRRAEQVLPERKWATTQGLRMVRQRLVVAPAMRNLLPFDPRGAVLPERLALALILVSAMVLLIAATNLTGVLLARGVSRRNEIGVRLALGAGRGRVVREVFAETLLVSAAACLASLVLSRALIELFLIYLPVPGQGWFGFGRLAPEVPLDSRVLLFTMAVAAVVSIVVGIMPALQAMRMDVTHALSSTTTVAASRSGLRRWMIVPQICFSIVLLLAAGVLVRTLVRAEIADRGFDPDGVLYATVAMPMRYFAKMTPEQRRAEDDRRRQIYQELMENVRALPGVQHAALATMSAWNGRLTMSVVTPSTLAAGRSESVATMEVSPHYFDAAGISIVRGRGFATGDSATATRVAIVCEQLARALWGDDDPVGQYVARHVPSRPGQQPEWLLVVGVAREVRVPGLEDRPTPLFYTPVAQHPRVAPAHVIVRGASQSSVDARALSNAIMAVNAEVEVPTVSSWREDIGQALYPRRLGVAVLAGSGVFGLLLSTIGLYGVVSYVAAQRQREVGIRTALGADRTGILRLVLRDALVTLGIAVACGGVLGFLAVRAVSSAVVALPGLDAMTFVAVLALICAVMLTACLHPARRAARVNPVDVLRGL